MGSYAESDIVFRKENGKVILGLKHTYIIWMR